MRGSALHAAEARELGRLGPVGSCDDDPRVLIHRRILVRSARLRESTGRCAGRTLSTSPRCVEGSAHDPVEAPAVGDALQLVLAGVLEREARSSGQILDGP
jgi:hypothetical protein